MGEVKIVIPYTPRVAKWNIHENLDKHRWSVLVLHRRFGKTVLLTNQLIKRAISYPGDDARFGYIAPTYKQAKTIAWDYLKRFTNPIPGRSYNEAELRCDLPNGSRIRLFGADNPDSLRGIYLDGVVLDEYGMTDPAVFTSIIRPALSDRKGWACFSGTPNGQNHFFDLWKHSRVSDGWFSLLLRASETNIIDQDELDDAKAMMSEEEYMREYECSFDAACRGAYYAKQMTQARTEGRIGRVPYDPAHEVYTAWDLGINDSMCIWFIQVINQEIRLIDYMEESGQGLPWFAKKLKELPYNYGDHYMPHDAGSKSAQTGMTMKQRAEELGLKPVIVVRRAKDTTTVIRDVTYTCRNLIQKCWFDEKKCARGISALESYRAEYDEAKQKLMDFPLHDWASHGSDAFRTFAVGYTPKVKHRNVSTIMSNFNFRGAW